MEEKRRIEEELAILKSLKLLAQAHEEISTIRMRLARGSVIANRDFLASLSEVFVNVKSAYKKHVQELMEKYKTDNKKMDTKSGKNGKEILVFLSANNKMYGDIIPKVFALFKENCKKKETADIAIVGKLGKELYDSSDIKRPYKYFEIADYEKDIEDLKPLISYILPYESVNVFYGKFLNVMTQEAFLFNVTGEESFETGEEGIKEYDFIFEPSIEKVFAFFESQTFFSLFKQTVHEAELARYGSRIKAMELALETINNKLGNLTEKERRVKNLIANKRQLERIAGMRVWE